MRKNLVIFVVTKNVWECHIFLTLNLLLLFKIFKMRVCLWDTIFNIFLLIYIYVCVYPFFVEKKSSSNKPLFWFPLRKINSYFVPLTTFFFVYFLKHVVHKICRMRLSLPLNLFIIYHYPVNYINRFSAFFLFFRSIISSLLS